MKRVKIGVLFALIVIAVTTLAISGCQSIKSLTGFASSTGRAVDSDQLLTLSKDIATEIVSIYESSVGKARVYGEVTNKTKKDFKELEISVFLVTGDRQELFIGKETLKNLRSGANVTFDIQTTADVTTSREKIFIKVSGAKI